MHHLLPGVVVSILIVQLSGCGPLMVPAVQRLDEEEQRQIDSAWSNMLSPPGRLDRQLLLDVLIVNQLHAQGVDRLTLRSEKALSAGRAVMEVGFDRASAEKDTFRVSIYDGRRRLVRRERYSGEDVWRTVKELSQTEPEDPRITPAKRAREQAIVAATQPAVQR